MCLQPRWISCLVSAPSWGYIYLELRSASVRLDCCAATLDRTVGTHATHQAQGSARDWPFMAMLAWSSLAILGATSSGIDPSYAENLNGFWNSVDKVYAHIQYAGGHLRGEKRLTEAWNRTWLIHSPRQNGNVFDNATVMEYGIGGGLLGKYLLEKYNARHYIGVDIADRQLEEASKRLNACCRYKYSQVKVNGSLHEADLLPFRIDVFVSQAVMQHFPSDSYTRSFLGVLSRSKIPYLMLQVRDGSARWQGASVGFAQLISKDVLATNLPNYEMLWQSRREKNGYVFYWWHLRE